MNTQDTKTIPDDWVKETAAMAIRQGHCPIPMKLNTKTKELQPAGTFKNAETYPLDHPRWKRADINIIGIRLGRFVLVDYDGNKPKGAVPLVDLYGMLGDKPNPVQENDKGDSLHFLYKLPDDFDITTLKNSKQNWMQGVDLLTMNQLIHLKKHKTIIDGELPTLNEVPDAPQIIIEALTKPTAQDRERRDSSPASITEAAEIVSHIDPDIAHSEWVAVGMGLKAEYKEDTIGFEIWDNWSEKGEKYGGTTYLQYKWDSFKTEGGTTFGTACKMAKDAGADLDAISNKHYDPTFECTVDFDDDDELNITSEDKKYINDFFQGTAITLEDMVTAPPPREHYIENFLPKGVIGIIGGEGGIGKSRLALQIAIAVASGASFLNFNVSRPEEVLFLSAEDDSTECKRRIHQIVNAREELSKKNKWFEGYKVEAFDRNLIAKNLMIKDLVGDGLFFTATEKGGIAKVTKQFEIIKEQINAKPDIKLIVVDTYSRFNGGNENSNDDSTQFVKACEKLIKGTDRTLIVIAHVVKSGSDKKSMSSVNDIAGGKRLTDSARWVVMLDRYLMHTIKDGMSPENLRDVANQIRMNVVKNNYVANEVGWLFTELSEYFAPCEKRTEHKERKQSKAVVERDRVSKLVIEELTKSPKSKNAMEQKAGSDTKFAVSGKVLLDIIGNMIEDNIIVEVNNPKARGSLLQLVSSNQVSSKVQDSQ